MNIHVNGLSVKGHENTVTIKIRTRSGCFHREHSPEAYKVIDEVISQMPPNDICFDLVEHESGPEIIAMIAFGTAGLTLAKSVVDLITAIIKARFEGKKKWDRSSGELLLIVRDTHRTATSTEEVALEIYDNDIVSSKQVKDAIEKVLNKKYKK